MSSDAPSHSTRTHFPFIQLSLGLTIALLIIIAVLHVDPGWDAQIFCSAVRVANSGGNPYDLDDLGLNLSWNYQPYLLAVFNTVCPFPIGFESSYPLVYSFLLMAGIALWKPGPDLLLALTLSLGCFWSFGWTFLTGNITAVEFLLISIVFFLLINRQWELAGLALGVMASIKLLTIVYIGLLLFIPQPNSRRWRVFSISLAAFVSTLLLSYVLYPNLMQPFLEQALGLIPNQHNVWMETGKMNNVPLAYLVIDSLALLGVGFSSIISTLVGAALSITIVLWVYRKVNFNDLVRRDYPAFFSLGLVALTLIIPRLKPYSFLMLAPALFYLIRSQGKGRQNLVVATSTTLPVVFFFVGLFSAAENSFVSLVLTYSPTIFLVITIAIVVYFINHPDQADYARTP